ncbi:MAG: hypothetical protein NZ956_03735 [Candidatus Caldarchaeum sp.]|nr:hypothetical protein [Candidatus Caldarchaeum sp.]
MRNLAATITSLSIMILLGGFMARDVLSTLPPLGYQTAILTVILSALSTLLTPLSSAVGNPSYIPPATTTHILGLWPIVAWIIGGVVAGLLSQKAKESVIPSLLTATMTYLMVVGLAAYTLPRIPNAINWEHYLTWLAHQIILDGPMNFVILFALPLVSALLTSSIIESTAPKPVIRPVVSRRRRYWDWPEDE